MTNVDRALMVLGVIGLMGRGLLACVGAGFFARVAYEAACFGWGGIL